jgi:hypothetical protein
MPTVTYTFQIPDELDELEQFQKSGSYRNALGDLWQKVRAKVKYEDVPDDQFRAYQQVRDWIAEVCRDWEVEVP